MSFRIAFFDTKPYDEDSFSKMNERFGFDIVYFKGHLNPNNVMLTQGFDAVCIFVNDIADAGVIDTLVKTVSNCWLCGVPVITMSIWRQPRGVCR